MLDNIAYLGNFLRITHEEGGRKRRMKQRERERRERVRVSKSEISRNRVGTTHERQLNICDKKITNETHTLKVIE